MEEIPMSEYKDRGLPRIEKMKDTASDGSFTDYILKAIQEEDVKSTTQDTNRLISNSSADSRDSYSDIDVKDSEDSTDSVGREFQRTRVLLGTPDAFYLNADEGAMLAAIDEEDTDMINFVFRKTQMTTTEVKKDGSLAEAQLAVFQLDGDPSCFLAITSDRRVIMQVYQSECVPDSSTPDERFFKVYQNESNRCLLESFIERGHYLHHMDDRIYLRTLDFNLRPPEEYIFVCEKVPSRLGAKKSGFHVSSCAKGIKKLFHSRCLGQSSQQGKKQLPER